MIRNKFQNSKPPTPKILLLIILILTLPIMGFAQTYQYSSGYHVNTNVTAGNFYDGGGPSAEYDASDAYTVTFIAPAGYNLIFHFTEFQLVGSGVLSIYNGLTDDVATKIGDFNLSNPIGNDLYNQVNDQNCSPYIISSGRAITFVFDANGTGSGDPTIGWQASIEVFPSSYAQKNMDEIAGQTIIYEGFFFDDGGFEDRYSANEYTTTFQAPPNHILKIYFMYYDIYQGKDQIDIYDNSTTSAPDKIANLSGNSDPVTYYSTGEYLTIDWISKSKAWDNTRRGWVAKIEAISVTCGLYNLDGTLDGVTTNTDCGSFYDDGGGGSDYNQNADYTTTFCSNNGLPLTFNFEDYEFADAAVLSVYDAATATNQLQFTTLNYFDDSDINEKYITSSGNCMTFNFNGDAPTARGWEAKIVTQPHIANNDICDASELTVYPARVMDSYNNVYATQSSVAEPGCVTTSGDFFKDVWFYFTVPADGLFDIDIETSNVRDMAAAIYTGSCAGTPTEEICSVSDNISFDQDDIATSLNMGDTVFVRVWGESGEAGAFNIGVYTPVAIACTDANYYPVTKEWNLGYVDLQGAGDSDHSPAPACGDYGRTSPFGDVWFKITVPESQELMFKTQKGNLDDINLAVYSGASCASSTVEYCFADAQTADLYYDASIYGNGEGDTLWVVYWGDKNNTNIGDYYFSIHDPEPESNNACDAVPFNVSGEESYEYYDNTGADDSGEADPGCSWTSGDKDMWFSFIAPKDGKATINTVGGSLLDIGLAVYSGTCASLSLIQCTNSDGSGVIDLPVTGLTADDSIFVRVWGDGASFGIYGLSISVENPDGPCDANLLTVQDYSAVGAYTFQGYSTTSNTASGITMPACGSGDKDNDKDMWFNAIVPASGQIGFQTQNASIPIIGMSLYNGSTANCTDPSGDFIQCTNGTGVDLNIELSGQTAGDTIRVRIWGYSTLTGYFEIAAYDAAASLAIVGISASYCYSETVSNYNIAGSPLGGTFTPSAGVLFTDNGDGTGTLHIGGDSTQWAAGHTLDYTFSGSTVQESFDVAASYIPTNLSDTTLICDGDAAPSFTATGAAGAVFRWYDDAALTNLVNTGASYTMPTNTWTNSGGAISGVDDFFYYITQEVDGCTSNDKVVLYQIAKIPETGPQYHIKNSWGN